MESSNRFFSWIKNVFKQRQPNTARKPLIMETEFIDQPDSSKVTRKIPEPVNQFNTIPKKVVTGIDVKKTFLMQQRIKQYVNETELNQQLIQSSSHHQVNNLNRQPIEPPFHHQHFNQPKQLEASKQPSTQPVKHYSPTQLTSSHNQTKRQQFMTNHQPMVKHNKQPLQSNPTFNYVSSNAFISSPSQLAYGTRQDSDDQVKHNVKLRLIEKRTKDRRKKRPKRCPTCGHDMPNNTALNYKIYTLDHPNYDYPKPPATSHQNDWRGLDYDSHPSHPPEARHKLKTQFKYMTKTVNQQRNQRISDSDCESCLFSSRRSESLHYNTEVSEEEVPSNQNIHKTVADIEFRRYNYA